MWTWPEAKEIEQSRYCIDSQPETASLFPSQSDEAPIEYLSFIFWNTHLYNADNAIYTDITYLNPYKIKFNVQSL